MVKTTNRAVCLGVFVLSSLFTCNYCSYIHLTKYTLGNPCDFSVE